MTLQKLEFQSKTKLKKLFSKHVRPLSKIKGGGAYLSGKYDGFFYLDEIEKDGPELTKRGQTVFILIPTISREIGHWVCMTVKSRGGLHIEYYDPAISKTGGIPAEILRYLESQPLSYKSNSVGIQDFLIQDSKCGIYCILFLKNIYS